MSGNYDERHLETHVAFEDGLTRRLARQLVTEAKRIPIRVRCVTPRTRLAPDLGIGHLVGGIRCCRVLLVEETS